MSDNAECARCGVTAADLPYEEMGLSLAEASEVLFDDGLCQGCVLSPGWNPIPPEGGYTKEDF